LAHGGAADRSETEFAVEYLSVARGNGEMYQAYRLARRRAARSRDAGDGYCEIDPGLFQRADRHRGRGFLADCAEGRKRRGLDAEHPALGVVGIGDEATVD